MNRDRRVLIVAFDGLRPDMATPDRMPNLARLRASGVDFTDCRSVFPTETRVNQASLVTGCHPARHGIVANKFVEPTLPGGFINTANFEALTEASDALDGALLYSPSLGEVLADAGGSLAVVGCGTPGGNRLLHHTAPAKGAVNVSAHGRERSTTPEDLDWIEARIGPAPAAAMANVGRIDWVARAYRDALVPERDPSTAILWFSDPDTPYHYRGLSSPEADAGIRAGDKALGELLNWRREIGRENSLQIFALSDHGHVAAIGGPLDVATKMATAGFRLSESLADGGDAVLVPGSSGSIYCRDADIQRAVVDWLAGQPWAEIILARHMSGAAAAPEGTLPLTAAGIDNARAGDIVFTTLRDAAPGPGGWPGRCLHDNPDIPDGCGLHGGLSRHEARPVLAAQGAGLHEGVRIDGPVGLIDVMAMTLALLDITPPSPFDGRVPAGALRDGPADADESGMTETVAAERAGRRQSLTMTRVGASRYLDEGRLADPPRLDDLAP